MMPETLRWMLLVLGVIYLITGASILAPLRQAALKLHPITGTLAYCSACTGFWVGFFSWGLFPVSAPSQNTTPFESALAAMVLGALWNVYGPASPYERETHAKTTTEESHDD